MDKNRRRRKKYCWVKIKRQLIVLSFRAIVLDKGASIQRFRAITAKNGAKVLRFGAIVSRLRAMTFNESFSLGQVRDDTCKRVNH